MSTTRTVERFAIVTIGRFGWTGHVTGHPEGKLAKTTMVSHGGETWKTHELLDDDTVIVDTSELDDLSTVLLAVHGPIIGPGLAPGTRSRIGDPDTAWDPAPQRGSLDNRFGNAGGMDTVSVDVYTEIAQRFGAKITTGADARAARNGER